MTTTSAQPHSSLRQRRSSNAKLSKKADDTKAISKDADVSKQVSREEVVWGKTPSGEVFRVPTTHDVLTTLFHPGYPKSHFDLLNLGLLALQIALYFVLPRKSAQILFFLYFAFWRAAYDAGLGWVLTKQSKMKWIVRKVQRFGWLDAQKRPGVRNWIKKQLVGKMGSDYSFDDLPLEYNTWLLFRQVVDVILVNDFLSYCMFSFSCFRVPRNLSITVHIMRWLGGIVLIGFNLWVKTEAHNVVKDYGWYWGDVFFQRGNLVFDGVFELAPHPMYSVGYAGYYGLSLISGNYLVLFVSLAAHAAQFAFLVLFENPHGLNHAKSPENSQPRNRAPRHRSTSSNSSSVSTGGGSMSGKKKAVSQHDLLNKYFRRDTVVLKNLDLLRASDIMLVLVMLYGFAVMIIPSNLSNRTILTLHFVHALTWCLIHYVGLGLLLRAQSQSKFLVRHYIKNYHYPDGSKGAIVEAFANWKVIYNMSMCMTYVSCFGVVAKTYLIPNDWSVGNDLLCHTLGALLIGLHIWASMESYEVLGLFGWFSGDFFMEEFPTHLEYTGIYRYLNNPEAMGGAAWFGLALISGSKLVLSLALIRHLASWWFLSNVENPHMRKLYGDSLRQDAGFVKVIKSILESRAGKHAPELKRVARGVKGTFDKVYEETADAVEEFLAKSRPRISEVVQDTKVLLQQSRERLVITRVANDLSSYETDKYRVSILPSPSTGTTTFYLGEPITVQWQAPRNHSRKDWIGLYRVGANKSTLVTKVSSLGMWLPVHGEEWDGDVPLGVSRPPSPQRDSESGFVTLKGNTLPWLIGKYEVRYHHDGKYNVMHLDGPIEIHVDQPDHLDLSTVRHSLMRIVPLCLDSDPSLIPISCKASTDPDDFSFWSERQAKRICVAIKQIFDVEYAPEVVVADANLTALANRILLSKEILTTSNTNK
ncbi:Phosphatidylethanolamine N-methyltransferase [Leucoagaricus sp. SymC.cos]|nr:Phosphatidylethanolamine N-methyltransferase [Leucoagaricus sp. SymC.cos]